MQSIGYRAGTTGVSLWQQLSTVLAITKDLFIEHVSLTLEVKLKACGLNLASHNVLCGPSELILSVIV